MFAISSKAMLIGLCALLFTVYSHADYTKGQRTYRRIQLKNGMDVLLVTDPKAPKSAASLSVGVGYTSDPAEHPGLAHFLEHLVFLGSEKYPKTDAYGGFVARNKGATNAFTGNELTNYVFEVNNNAFENTLDRFSSMLISPLFKSESIEKEINAVHGEFLKDIPNDSGWRARAVYRHTGNPAHPQTKFGGGNLEALKNVDRQVVQAFFKKYYVAPLMKLVLLSSISLDELEVMANKHFSSVAPSATKRPKFNQTPMFLKSKLPQLIYQKTYEGKDVKLLTVMLELPEAYSNRGNKPTAVISYFLNFKGPNTLVSRLEDAGLATSVGAGAWDHTYGSQYLIKVDLTKSGYKNVDEVIKQISTYLRFIRENGIPESFYNRVKKITDIEHRFEESGSFFNESLGLASSMWIYPDEKLQTTQSTIFSKYDKAVFKQYTDKLDINNAKIYLLGPDLPVDSTTKHYKVEYSKQDISKQQLQKWSSGSTKGINLPRENPYLPTQFQTGMTKCSDKPCRLKDTTSVVWQFQDQTYQKPKGNVVLFLQNKGLISSPRQTVLLKVFAKYLGKYLSYNSDFSSLIAEAGYSMGTVVSRDGLTVTLSGYNDKLLVVASEVFARLGNLSIDQELYDRSVEEVAKQLNNKLFEGAINIGFSTYLDFFGTNYYTLTNPDLLSSITPDDLKRFYQKVISSGHLDVYSYGQISSKQLSKIKKSFVSSLNVTPKYLKNPRQNYYLVPKGKSYATETSSATLNNSWIQSYQLGPRSVETEAIARLLYTLWESSYSEELRDEQQLGYAVGAAISGGGKGSIAQFIMYILSGTYDAKTLRERSETWLSQKLTTLESMDKEQFAKTKVAIITDLNKPFINLNQASAHYYDLIYNADADFDYYEKVSNYLRKLSAKDFAAKVRKLFTTDKRSFSTYVHAKGKTGPAKAIYEVNVDSVKDFQAIAEKVKR